MKSRFVKCNQCVTCLPTEEGITKTFTCARSLVGQHVFLQLVGVEGSLSVCEVEVFTTDGKLPHVLWLSRVIAEFSNDRCAPPGSAPDVELASFERTCYEFSVARGGSFSEARAHCKSHGGDLVYGLQGAASTFLLQELERRKPRLKTQLVWVGAQREPGILSRTWRWVDGEVVAHPAWGKDQPNNYNGEQNCVVLDGGRNWLWNDVGCNLDYLHWVCQRCCWNGRESSQAVGWKRRRTFQTQDSSLTIAVGEPTNSGKGISKTRGINFVGTGISYATVLTYPEPFSTRWGEVTRRRPPSDCGSPDKLLNTTISGTNYSVGAVIAYHCPEGHKLVGDKNRTCTSSGFWSGLAPSCQYVDCGTVPSLEHGAVILVNNRTTHGAVARYSCHENYTLIGREERTCGDDSLWSEEAPECLFDWCPEPPTVHGGTVDVKGHRAGSTAFYTCQSGFILFGQPVLSCGLGGEWSGKAPTCKFVDCGAPPLTDNGHYTLLNGTTTYASLVEYSCDHDYWLDGTEVQTCTREGKWSADTPNCVCEYDLAPEGTYLADRSSYLKEMITCDEPEVPSGSYVVGYDFNVHSTIEYHCDVGHILRGQAMHECTMQGEWSGEPPTCEYVDCGKVPPMPYGSVVYVNKTTYLGSEIHYNCTRHYRLAGTSSRICQENGLWSGESPRCEEIRCPEPVVPEHSILSVTNNDRIYGRTLIRTPESAATSVATYKINSLLKYRCERGYKIVGEPLSTCEESGRWSGEVPQCTSPMAEKDNVVFKDANSMAA
ncbi:hypothetical protein PR048_002405 [Dryococelus australis]|uniref:Uncharacterized protein n=1 Tax=Dryococelus australis TaxID=614101 RepID=A0ABQ9IK71_9NEOP|nr:hypothetical protein PR048_002405 [Dryococelus australis]